jgi:lysophospholipase
MTLVSIPANPVPEDVVTGTLKTSDGVSLRFFLPSTSAGFHGSFRGESSD